MIRTSSFVCAFAALISLFAPTGDTRQEPASEPAYPTFTPFTSSRMFEVMIGDPSTLDFEATAQELTELAEAFKAAAAAAERLVEEKRDGPSAFLEPRLADEVRAPMPLLPAALMKLEPLWSVPAWSPEQLASAQDVAKFVATLPDGLGLAFVADEHEENAAQLRALVKWYRSRVERPELYAAMIPTFDIGPFAGLPYEAEGLLEAVQTSKIPVKTSETTHEVELRLCKVDRAKEPFVLQAVREGKVLWSRVVSGGPDESVREVELRGNPQGLGEYGWKVYMTVAWSQGVEAAYLYIDTEGNLLFYFMSW